ncbi:hypothetical protein [Micromonospora sp. NPDC023956]|uniref:hypothetical protein n=1 Tax=Micromonospora sp. NPDC023956 TaxID=3155722 RepID=UPI0033EDA609
MTAVPLGLGSGGRELWTAIADDYELDPTQKVQLLEACRAKDRLDKLDGLLRGDVSVWARLTHRLQTDDYELKIDAALTQANATANLMKQLLAALRLPDPKTGKRPQYRGPRGAQAPSVPGGRKAGTVTNLRDRLRDSG